MAKNRKTVSVEWLRDRANRRWGIMRAAMSWEMPEMKRYMIFVGYNYYPSGGMQDFAGSYDTMMTAFFGPDRVKGRWGWAHVLDTITWQTTRVPKNLSASQLEKWCADIDRTDLQEEN